MNSDKVTRVSFATDGSERTAIRLVDADTARPLRVECIADAWVGSLAAEGISAGVELEVERRLALGGPVVVRLGRARLALARSVAAAIVVTAVGDGR